MNAATWRDLQSVHRFPTAENFSKVGELTLFPCSSKSTACVPDRPKYVREAVFVQICDVAW